LLPRSSVARVIPPPEIPWCGIGSSPSTTYSAAARSIRRPTYWPLRAPCCRRMRKSLLGLAVLTLALSLELSGAIWAIPFSLLVFVVILRFSCESAGIPGRATGPARSAAIRPPMGLQER
jgi:hypothetical protein